MNENEKEKPNLPIPGPIFASSENEMEKEEEEEEEEEEEGIGIRKRKKRIKEAENSRQRRRKPRPGESWCPVCGVTLRSGELESHLTLELDKLVRLPHTRTHAHTHHNRPSSATTTTTTTTNTTATTAATTTTPSTSSVGGRRGRRRGRGRGIDWEKYVRIKSNRTQRRGRRRGGEEEHVLTCPVCGEEEGHQDQDFHQHIDDCLRRVEEDGEDVEEVEVETYEWCGETRVRATQMLRSEGQLHALGTRVERGSEDEVVDVCDDDEEAKFGATQYTDADLPTLPDSPTYPAVPEPAATDQNPSPTVVAQSPTGSAGLEDSEGGNGDSGTILEALRVRVRELEEASSSCLSTCRVCHGNYNTPLVSIVCWHVHCKSCWLSAMASRRLCPQCSVITGPSDLRRIYL